MAGNNKIGIEVQVEFPTAEELRRQLSQKWQGVKNSFDAKINLDIDGTSLRQVKSKIKKALSEDAYNIKLSADGALHTVDLVQKELKKLDAELNKHRELKINLVGMDMSKPFAEILQDVEKIDRAIAGQTGKIKEQNQALDQQAGKFAKIQQIQKELKDGSIATTTKVTTTDDSGGRHTTTTKPDGRVDVDSVHDREKAIKEIEDVMKRIYKISQDQVGADEHSNILLQEEKRLQEGVLANLKQEYQMRYSANATDDERISNLQRQQQMERELLAISKQQKQEQKEVADAIAKIIQLENQKNALSLKMIGAKENEKQALAEQYEYYNRIQVQLRANHSLEEKMSATQRAELDNLRAISQLEVQRAEAKQRDAQATKEQVQAEKQLKEEQKQALSQMKSDLKEVHSLRLKIAEIEARNASKNGDLSQLNILRQELEIAQQRQQANKNIADSQGHITDEAYRELTVMSQINQSERERVARTAQHVQAQQEINAKVKEYEDSIQRVSQLQRDLVFAGSREQSVIEEQLSHERQKLQLLRDEVQQSNLLTEARKRELAQIEENARAELHNARERQGARDRDREFGSATGGFVDPMSTYMNARQGVEEVVSSMALVDEAYMRVAKVADASRESLTEFKHQSYDTASSLGVSADAYMKAVETWVTAGETFASSQELAKTSLIGSFVGNIDPDLMVKWMSVPMKAFETNGLKANDIINVMNETANSHAVEMEELGKAYMRSATTVKTAGVSFEELTGLITGAQEATRMGGERIGTALKTVSLNYNLIQSQMTKDQKKKFDFFESIGINLKDTSSLTDALEKLHGKWGELSEEQQSTSLFYLAGKEHSNVVSGILSQWDTVNESIADAREQMNKGEDGSAYEEFGKQKESVRFQIAELKNAWLELMNTIGESDGTINSILQALVSGLQKASDLMSNEKFMESAKLVAIAVAMHGLTNGAFRLFDALSNGARGAWKNLDNLVPSIGKIIDKFKDARRASDEFNDSTRANNASNRAGDLADDVHDLADRNRNDHDDHDRNRNSGGDNDRNRHRNLAQGAGDVAEDLGAINTRGTQVEGTMGRVMSKAGSLIGLIPFIGDALVVLDIVGVPVFETLGAGFDALTKKTTDATKEQKKYNDEFAKNNRVMNGDVKDGEQKMEKLHKKFEATDADENTEGIQGYMTPEEFNEFSKQVNEQVDKFKLGTDLKITMNDTAHIQEQLAKIDEGLKKVKEREAVDITEKIGGNVSKLEESRTQIGALKNEQINLSKESETLKGKMEALRETDGSIKPEHQQSYMIYAGQLAEVEGRQAQVKNTLDHQTTAFENSQKAVQNQASSLLSLGDGMQNVKVATENQIPTLKAMYSGYNSLKKSLDDSSQAQQILSSGQELTNEQFQQILTLVPEAKKQYGSYNHQQINGDAKAREGLVQLVNKEHEHAKASENAGQKAVTALEGQARSAGHSQKSLDDAKKSAEGLGNKVKDIPENKTVKAHVEVTGIDWLDKVINFFSKSWSTTATIEHNGQGFGSASGSKYVSAGKSASTSSVSKSVSASVGTGLPVMGVGKVVSKDTSSSDQPPKKISENVWRYWDTEDKMDELSAILNPLQDALKDNADNYKELIRLYQEQIPLLRQQMTLNKTLLSKKESEMDSVLNKLSGYGFSVNTSTNNISNLSHAKDLSGDSAQKAEELLNKWKSLGTELTSINGKIVDLGSQIKDIDTKIKDAKIKDELKDWETYLKRVDALLTSVNNRDDIYSRKIGFISGDDKELGLLMNAQAMNASKNNIVSLVNEFNKLSKTTISYEENGKTLKGTLDKLKSEILQQADSIVKYNQAINDLEFERVTKDLDEFNRAVDSNSSKINNNIKNLKEGLISGAKFKDLASSASAGLDLSRNNQYEKLAQDRINLEKKLQQAMDGFEKKNIERRTGVANEILAIEANKYNQLLKMEDSYSAGTKSSYKAIKSNFGELVDIGKIDDSYTFITKLDDAFDKLKEKQDRLTNDFDKSMKKSLTPKDRENLTNQFIIDNLRLQEEYYKASINSNKKAVSELKKQLNDSTLTDDQENKIKQQIENFEKANMDSQNKIKASIKDRFDFEFSLLDKSVKEYDDYGKELEYSMSLIKTLGGDNFEAKDLIVSGKFDIEKVHNDAIQNTLASLQTQLGLYKKGSFEWNLINAKVKEYQKLLKDSNLQLLEINKNIMSNSFDSIMDKVEKSMFDGKTVKGFKDYHDLWITGLEREIALEDMYKRIADIGTKAYDQKMELFSKQEKLSRFEMDYLNKQLNVLELQNKLENLSKERTIQTLKEKADGTWDWSYEADAEEISKVKKDLSDAQLKLQEAEEKAREDYVNKLNGILDNAEKGGYSSAEDFQDAIKDLTNAYSSIVGDFPKIRKEYLKELVSTYKKYIKENEGVLGGSTVIPPDFSVSKIQTGLSNEIVTAFKSISKEIGNVFADALLSKMPAFSAPKKNKGSKSQSVSINLEKVEFPNITSSNGIKDAILSLPQIALQKSKEK